MKTDSQRDSYDGFEREPANVSGGSAAMTLIEVVVAMAMIAMLSAGIIALGIQTRRVAEHSRVATEARSLAKERLEEIVAIGLKKLAHQSCTLTFSATNVSSRSYPMLSTPVVFWHDSNRNIVAPSNAAYAEVHIDVCFFSPFRHTLITNTYSTLVQ